MTAETVSLVRPPRQERSRRTLERILDVTEDLLKDRSFESITVNEIVHGAQTSVGAFYSRFRDKDALLPALYVRYDHWIRNRAQRLEAEQPWEGKDLRGVVEWFVSELATMFRHRRYLLRAAALHARQRPEKIDSKTRSRRASEMSFLRSALLTRREEIRHPDPERAVDIAIFMAVTQCREAMLFSDAPHAASIRLTQRELVSESVRMVLGYLGVARE